MGGRRLVSAALAVLVLGVVPLAAHASAPSRPAPARVTSRRPGTSAAGFVATILHFTVDVGPADATPCDVIGEYFAPTSASASAPVPAILTTNGFGGSYTDQVDMAQYFARRGYAVLTYSGLGFGGSGCAIELDDPDWDGAAASQLISWLGDQPEIIKDGPDDPRVGMVGGSYGGGVQFSTAAVDPRLDTIIPVITWNDLAYSLTPNNSDADFVHTDVEPGVLKLGWPTLFFADGLAQPLMNGVRGLSTCPGFDTRVCASFATSAALGYPTRATIDLLRHASMVSFASRVRIPTMLMQGEGDTLFTINEAVANYQAIRANGAPVKLVIQSWGHSVGPQQGETGYGGKDGVGYDSALIAAWFAKYLTHQPVSTGPAVEYYRDWVPYGVHASAEPAYGTAPAWPVGSIRRWFLSGAGALVTTAPAPTRQSFLNSPVGSFSEIQGVQGTPPLSAIRPFDAPATFAQYETPALAAGVDSVGVPLATLTMSSLVPAGLDPVTDPVVFAKLYDVAPDGTADLVQRLVSPVRLDDLDHPVTITLPGVVHRYAAGHRIELVLATGDATFAGSRIPNVLTVTGGTLDLPVVGIGAESSGGSRATGT